MPLFALTIGSRWKEWKPFPWHSKVRSEQVLFSQRLWNHFYQHLIEKRRFPRILKNVKHIKESSFNFVTFWFEECCVKQMHQFRKTLMYFMKRLDMFLHCIVQFLNNFGFVMFQFLNLIWTKSNVTHKRIKWRDILTSFKVIRASIRNEEGK